MSKLDIASLMVSISAKLCLIELSIRSDAVFCMGTSCSFSIRISVSFGCTSFKYVAPNFPAASSALRTRHFFT